MSTPVTIADEKRAIAEQWSALLLKVQQDDREITPEEQTQLDAWDVDMKALTGRQQAREKTAELLRRFQPTPTAAPVSNGAGRIVLPGDGAGASEMGGLKSLGRQYIDSAGYLEFKSSGGPRGGSWSSPIVELKAPTLPPTYALSGTGILQGTTLLPLPPALPTMLSLLATGTTDGGVVYYLREILPWTNNAAVVAAGAAKPESPKTFEYVQQPLVKIAHWVAVADEMLMDVAGLETFINSQMARGVLYKLEQQVLAGTGTGGEMTGLLVVAGVPSVAHAAGTPYATAIQTAIATVQAAGFQPNGIVVNPLTWSLIVSESSPNAGYYIGPGSFQDAPALRLWGLPVVTSAQMVAGTALVGAFNTGAILYRKEAIAVQASNSHTDYFTKNITTLRAEARAALAVLYPTAFCEVTGLVAA